MNKYLIPNKIGNICLYKQSKQSINDISHWYYEASIKDFIFDIKNGVSIKQYTFG